MEDRREVREQRRRCSGRNMRKTEKSKCVCGKDCGEHARAKVKNVREQPQRKN